MLFHVNLDSFDLAGPFWLWIGGYLASFFVFMFAQRTTKRRLVPMYFLASLLPFAADGLAVVSTGLWLLSVLAAVLAAGAVVFAVVRDGAFDRRAVAATGTVLEVMSPALGMNVITNDAYIHRTLRLHVVRDDGTPAYEAKVGGEFMFGTIPDVGDTIALRVDPKNANHIVMVDDVSSAPSDASVIATAEKNRQMVDQLAKMAAKRGAGGVAAGWSATPPSGGVATGAGGGGSSVADSLAELDRLHGSGALSDSEFASAKAKLLG
jgi:hypothetical protein